MATYTTNYNLNKPTFSELADVRTFNGNMDIIDDVMNASQNSIAEPYDSTETYNEGDMVMYELYLYKCLEETTGTWDATKWERAYSASSGAGITYPQDATKYLNGMGQWTVPAGGGGSSSGVYVDELIFDTYVDGNGTYSLTKSIDNYDALLLCGYGSSGDSASNFVVSQFVTKAEFSKKHTLLATVSGETRRVFITFPDSTHVATSSHEGNISLRFIYGIKMSGDYYSPVIYSTEEREVGVWIDNKPLYQKTWDNLNVSVAYNSWTDIVQIADIDEVVAWEALATDGKNLNGSGLEVQYSNDNDYIKGEYNQSANVRTVGTFTVWYTKTTDTAGSGSYNTLGVPTHHYSTDEQVVGTWIDGSTLYQRTYTFNDIQVASGGAWVDLNIDISDISVLVDGKFGQDVAVWNVLSAINDNGALKVTNAGSGTLTISRVTIQYTK